MAEQLILESIKGAEIEKVPVAPIITLPHASRLYGIKPYEYIFDSDKYASAQIHAKRHYGYDWVFAHQIFQGLTAEEKRSMEDRGDHYILKLELGTVFKIPKDASPFIIEKAVKDKEGANRLAIPDTHHPDRTSPIKKMVKEEDFVCGNVRCPFTFASTFLYDAESFYMDLKRDEKFVHDLLNRALEYCIESGLSQIEAGVGAMFVEDPSASPNVISPETFRKTALPYDTKLIKRLKKKVPVIFHICGETTPILDDMIATGAACISLDECMDMEKVHKKTAVWGNLAPNNLVKAPPSKVREEAERIANLGTRVVLSSGCVVPSGARPENIREMVRAAHGD